MEALLQLDGGALLWIQENVRNAFLNPIVTFITHLGDHGYLWIALLLVLLVISKTRKAGLIGAATLLLTFLVNNQCIKPLVARTRPYEVIEGLTILIKKPGEFSFPSGHTSAAFAFFTCLALMTPRKFAPLWMTAAWAVAYSRIYLSQHFLEDILLGSIIGVLSSCIVYVLMDNYTNKRKFINHN